MFKVVKYVGNKQKAIRRLRRYETHHKKYYRALKYDRGEYSLRGYYVIRQKERINYIAVRSAKKTSYISIAEKIGKPVFIVKKPGYYAKYFRNQAARKIRRQRIEENTPALKGSVYKKYNEVQWGLL